MAVVPKILIPCEQCGHETPQLPSWLQDHADFTCRCGALIRLDREQFLRELQPTRPRAGRFQRWFTRLEGLTTRISRRGP